MSKPNSITLTNVEAAFAGDSMAHIKYLYFARIARAQGDIETAELFEETASQEVQHAFGHLDVLYPKGSLTAATCLEKAIEGETYEYSEMYPRFREQAVAEQRHDAVSEIDEQIAESKEHAQQFAARLAKAERRFDALARVEEIHANRYRARLAAASR